MMQDVHAGQTLRQGRGGRCMAAQGPGLTRAPRRDLGSSPATPITLLACSLQCCMLQLQARLSGGSRIRIRHTRRIRKIVFKAVHNPLRSPNRTTGVYIAAAMNLAVMFGYILVLSTVFAYSYQTYGYQPCHHSGVVNVSFDENSGRTVRRLLHERWTGFGW